MSLLLDTTAQMASSCSVNMALWEKHSNACIEADAEITRLRLERDGLAQRAEAFRLAVIESGALNHVPQSAYFTVLRRLEQAIAAVGKPRSAD